MQPRLEDFGLNRDGFEKMVYKKQPVEDGFGRYRCVGLCCQPGPPVFFAVSG